MPNQNIEKVVINAEDFTDTFRRCNVVSLQYIRTALFCEYEDHTFTLLPLYVVTGEYEDNGEIIELITGDDGTGDLVAFEDENEWLDYIEKTFGHKLNHELG